jgi:formamidopyrimidine-DNA glycosylase
MPELPEVECIVRTLRPHLAGKRIHAVAFRSPLAAGGRAAETAEFLAASLITAVLRRGKFVVLELDRGFCAIHLRMTGRLVWNGAEGPHTRAVFTLESGRLVLDDIRQFARVYSGAALPEAVAALGPEPFELTPAEFRRKLQARRGRIKPLLLDQRFLAGLGNIYTDEALHRARIHPLQPVPRLSAKRMEALHTAMVEVLEEAIAAGGSSISDYVDGAGRRGGFQIFHRVYGREGEPCPQCAAPVRRIVAAQRGTHYCPRCQRLQ